MKKEEKQLIFSLLKTADEYECGYTREKFAVEPVFTDDVEEEVQMSGSSPNMTYPTKHYISQSIQIHKFISTIKQGTYKQS
jgi:hypothetical protein